MVEIILLTELQISENSYNLSNRDRDFIIQDKKRLELTYDNKIKAKGYVGSLTLPSQEFVIQIEPKIGHTNFLHLLSYTYLDKIMIDFDGIARADEGKLLIEIFAQLFIKETTSIIKSGLYRNYITITDEVVNIRGRLLIAQNIRSPQKIRTKHWCEFDEISYDVLVNQCILYSTELLSRLITNLEIKNDLIKIKNIFMSQNVTLTKISVSKADSIILHRLNKKYENIIEFCKLILKKFAYGEFAISGNLIPDITFSMWYLFQQFVHKALKDSFPSYSITKPNEEHVIHRILNYSPEDEHFRNETPMLEPDNVIRKGNKKLILDTKYEENITNENFYQAISYSLKFGCDVILLQPKVTHKISDGFQIDRTIVNEDLKIHIKTIDFEQAENDSGNFIGNLQTQLVNIIKSVNF